MTEEIVISTGREDRPISGLDTSMLSLPEPFIAHLAAGDAIVVGQLGQFLRELSEKQAADLGERLHHADWVVTQDPATVQSRGIMHDCDDCRASVRAALRWLTEHPGKDLLVGVLYWAG